jgi:hypothetical protein
MAGRLITTVSTLCMIAAIGGGGWAIWRLLRHEDALGPTSVVAEIGSTRVHYDPAYGRGTDERNGGKLDRLDLTMRFPSFAPAGLDASTKSNEPLLFLRIEDGDQTLPPEERAAKLYVRFLEPEQWTNPGGLVMRRFQAESPYEREELYFAPPEGRLFAARCTRPRQPPDGLPETCINDIRVNGLDVHMRFSPEMLPEWEPMVQGARALVERMTR